MSEVDAEPAVPSLFRITDIHPVPDDETLAAITAALHEAWPKPVAATSGGATAVQSNWRFGRRRWRERAIPRQTWGRART